MDRLIYTAMTGANAAANRQAILSSNLANASTNGFRAQLETYRAVPLNGEGASTRVFAVEATAGFSSLPGQAQQTNRPLDAMTTDKSWFAVQGLDGNEAYTRNGSFEVTADGTLTTANGRTVLDIGGSPITVPAGSDVTMGHDGSISAKAPGQPIQVVTKLKQVTPTAEDPLKRGEDGLFRSLSGEPLNNDETARLHVGVLEGSNVNVIEAMVGMIQTARQFEAQTKLMTTAEANDRSAAQLLGLQG
ncbi:flagellar biosynthesis protein FlgF [Rhodoferax lacus]|uniref:Flagellar basal-body rod protein FlgF n=1 Tax=Rhodoferax lacus TaxID=2184758 RepID=A0A3E1R6R1_9BURK|nr:flagellar basal body rod protein FlgF [Rhodoferax lacus]RFO95049.1 flagellar biosynthesis protein FlgF [Rhodoferax lacus]